MTNWIYLFLVWVQTMILGLGLKGLAKTVNLVQDNYDTWNEELSIKRCALVEASKLNLREAAWVLGDQLRENRDFGDGELERSLQSSVEILIRDLEHEYGKQLDVCEDKKGAFDLVLEMHEGQQDHWPNWVYRRHISKTK